MLIIVAIVVIALAFDYINGFHDAANSIATIVSTRVLTPRQAVVWAGFFNFIAFTVFPLHVAHTIGKGIIDPKIITDAVLLGALGGAIAWNLITWWYGLPSSSSHALVGGLLGAGSARGGSRSCSRAACSRPPSSSSSRRCWG
jgi:PiT family inorganic phosphate transporter